MFLILILSTILYADKSEPRTPAEVTRYSSEEMNSGNESNEVHLWTEQERQADFNRRKEELLKRKRRRKKRTSSSIQSSCFQGKFQFNCFFFFCLLVSFSLTNIRNYLIIIMQFTLNEKKKYLICNQIYELSQGSCCKY